LLAGKFIAKFSPPYSNTQVIAKKSPPKMKPITTLGDKKKDGSRPVYIYLYIEKERTRINTKVSVQEDQWDDKKAMIKGRTKDVADQNLIIEKCRSRINQILVKYRLGNKTLTTELFRSEYANPSYELNFLTWMEQEIKIKKYEVGPRRIIKYNTILNKLKEYKSVIHFSEIDHFFIESYRGWMKKVKQNDINTVSSNLAVLKSFTNRALRKKLIENDPFLDIKIGRGNADRIYCDESDLKKLWDLYNNWTDVSKTHQHKILRHFFFMCMTGLRISDFKAATFDNIVGNMLFFYPIKTRSKKKQVVKIPLNQFALKLIADEKRTEGCLFEPCSEQRMNVNLKDIAKKAGINKQLTNHSGRHTFATLFIHQTNDVATLQKLLGHTRIEETMVYVHINESDLVKQMDNFTKSLEETFNPKTPETPI
jgi:integrase/recombinase XerD